MPDDAETFLDSYSADVQKLASGARALIRRLVPDAEEKVLRPWKMIAYGHARKFCAISPQARWVNLHFHQGATLPDPSGLLEGTGKSARHVKVTSLGDLRRRPLAALLRAASRAAW